MDKTKLGDRMKMYEKRADIPLMPNLPIIVRLDGRAFHSYCKGLTRPYDMGFLMAMSSTMSQLVEEANALVGYTQSDEISLMLYNPTGQTFFGEKRQKLVSILAAMATHYFNEAAKTYMPEHNKVGFFDARVYQVPTVMEAYNSFLWRQQDAVRNSVLMLTQGFYSAKDMHGKNQKDCHEMLHAIGQNWNDHPRHFKEGIFARRMTFERPFTVEELELLPEKHHARTNPNLVVKRSMVSTCFQTLSQLEDREGWMLGDEDAK